MSGLPLEISVKFQINMAMRDVSNMAHVERFSNIVVPMVWFEIVSFIQCSCTESTQNELLLTNRNIDFIFVEN